ncbi:hypothetical protein DUI87_13009 [Hirundo rustica rustica]|uniref:IQ motif and ubiquitin-like domain-containing protein n=1 Tax=Hirundo rustica rustica TaxID=333673 RepID=A0A3M0KAQ8_HIRRU|nr:hypothetical protein DUI87_13009 [Hirundo rustica rustica]
MRSPAPSAASSESAASAAMAGALRKTTGLVGLAVAENPHERLRILYTKILGVLQNIPKDAAYRKYTEQIVNERFDLVKKETDVQKLQDKLNSGQIEEVIVQCCGTWGDIRLAVGHQLAPTRLHFGPALFRILINSLDAGQEGTPTSLIEDNESLWNTGPNFEETVQSENKECFPGEVTQQDYHMPDVITVRVPTGSDSFQEVVVKIERPTYNKPFLGGFRNVSTGVEFHNAGSQTKPKNDLTKEFSYFVRKHRRWKAYDGKITEMDTQNSLRGKELLEVYQSISTKDIPKDERISVLLTLKCTVKEHECKLTQEIVALIDREVDLMSREVKECNLEGLRKRICTLFLQYIKIPEFNPGVAGLLKVPQDPLRLYQNVYFCHSCEKYLAPAEFPVPANSHTIGRCRSCYQLDNEARQREAYLKYRLILENLRKSEVDYQDDSKIVFLVQLPDLQYLIENIWNCQSALSACSDLYDLVMVRWDKQHEWSPWNTILLTKEEADAHLKLCNLQKPVEPPGVVVTKGQNSALFLIEPHTAGLGPSIQPVQIPLQSLPTFCQINAPAQLAVCKLMEGSLDPLIQIIDQDWPQD